MWRHQSEWPLLEGQRSAVYSICDDYFGFEHPRIKFCQGENHAISVLRLGENVSGHRRTSKLLALRNSGTVKELFKKYSLICFLFLVVRIHYRERFPRHLLQVNYSQYERGRNSTGDSEFRNGRGTLSKHLPPGRKKLRQYCPDHYGNADSNYATHQCNSPEHGAYSVSQSFSNITSVDLITAEILSPTFSFISSALRFVITLSIRFLPTRMTT